MIKLFKYLLYILPLILCFSYYPLIKLGENETMYFELSLPLIWLVLFDILGFIMLIMKYRRKLFTKIFGSVFWWLFPLFVSFSVIWSLNALRGILTVGLLWALFFAVLFFWEFRENLDSRFWKIFWRWFFGSALFVCAWCVVQCILDVVGVPQEASLLCDGCVYQMFGFPHPNGFAIEPQFMGNLLLAPIFVIGASLAAVCPSGTLRVAQVKSLRAEKHITAKLAPLLFFVLVATLFLTFSRGAIYACVVGLIFFDFFVWARAKKSEKKAVCKNIMKTVGIFVAAFLFTLNLQGVLAAVSPTVDTYGDGVAKVIDHLSLGVIDIRGKSTEPAESSEKSEGKSEGKTEATFDGYVAESTDTRVRLTKAAFDIWKKDFKTVMVGVGIGGAGQALYDNGLSPAPREIVQNEYASILLETGLVGVALLLAMLILAVKMIIQKCEIPEVLLPLLVAYGVSLIFFSGFPNALQIVLLPGILFLFSRK